MNSVPNIHTTKDQSAGPTRVQKKNSSFFPPIVQRKLTVNPPNDIYEQEADGIAERVMRMPDTKTDDLFFQPRPVSVTSVQRKCSACEQDENLQRKEDDEEPIIQQKKTNEQVVQRQCAGCEEEESYVQMKGETGNADAMTAPGIVSDVISSRGRPMDNGTRAFMESRFGYNFGNVQIHDDHSAHQSSKRINALAYTHGEHIVFGAGQYQPKTNTGKKLLAHELTHVLQQGSAPGKVQRVILPNTFYPTASLAHVFPAIDIHKKDRFKAEEYMSPYIESYFRKGYAAPVKIKYGPWGEGLFHISPRLVASEQKCDVSITPVTLTAPLIPLPIIFINEHCHFDFNAALSTYDAQPQVIPFKLPGLDTSGKNGTLVMSVSLNSSVTSGKVGWVEGKTKDNIDPVDDYKLADFSENAFLPLIYGTDYDGKNFTPWMYTNAMNNGYLIFNSVGHLSIANQQQIFGLLQLGDTNNWWHSTLRTNIMGAKAYDLPIKRTEKGELSGEGEGLTLDEIWRAKGFAAGGKLQVSYANSNFFVLGTANYSSARARGELLVVVTNYTTAKRYAVEYLPEEIAQRARTDPPPDPADRLAFAGAGNIEFTLFDGNKQNRKIQVPKTGDLIGEKQKEQPNKALQAFASFVVEPEGYITIAGQVKTKEAEFILFRETDPPYKKEIKFLNVLIATIPGPLGSSADFVFTIGLVYGASIGPLKLSEIKADGRYSNRPYTASELELSALVELSGKLFVKLESCISLDVNAFFGFSATVLEYCINGGIAAGGTIQARPTIQVENPAKDPDRNSPAEYFIRGSFNFDAAGQLLLQVGDSLTINLRKKDPADPARQDPDDQKEYKYKKNRKTVTNKYGGRDVEIPMDHTLGSKEIPQVSLGQFLKGNLKSLLTKLITQDRPPKRHNEKEYFETGTDVKGAGSATPKDNEIRAGGYEEIVRGREERRGKIVEKEEDAQATAPAVVDDRSKYIFTEPFTMNGTYHQLHLIITKIATGAKTEFDSIIMMESELEEIDEKIEEEKIEIQSHPDPAKDLKTRDLDHMQALSNRIKADAKQLGIDDNLASSPQVPALKQLAIASHNYGDRHKKKDIGIPDQTIQPKCDKPTDVHSGQEIRFHSYKGGENVGRVIEVVSYVTPNRKSAYWHIRFRPYGARTGHSVAPPAFDENCKPTFHITRALNCEGIEIKKNETPVAARIVNDYRFGERYKADWIKAYPLCWGTYLDPADSLVGLDRIHPAKQGKWHRAHLLHGNMGGEGARWNLVPVPKHINNDVMPAKYENKLKDLVQQGIATGKLYWFKAKVIYHKSEDNVVIGYYSDFVKEIHVFYGELDKDAQGRWVFLDENSPKATVDEMKKIPLHDDLHPGRIKG